MIEFERDQISAYYNRDTGANKSNPGELAVNKTYPIFTVVVCMSVLVLVGLACGSLGKQAVEGPATTANSGGPSNTAATSIDPVALNGKYDATGTNPDGSKYSASLTITQRGDVYQFSWESGGNLYDGVGVANSDTVAVGFTDGQDGKGCGVVLYDINADGSLSGKSGYWGVDSQEREAAKRTSGTGLEGRYEVTGTNPGGKEYTGTLDVSRSGAGYAFKWNAGETFTGFGIRSGDDIAVGFGGNKCSFVAYDIGPDGTLDGKWGGPGSTTVGTELAKKK